MKLLIKNIQLIRPDTILENKAVVIDESRIEAIIDASDIDETAYDKVYDGAGRYMAPGLIDIHTHGNSGYDTMDATPEALESMSEFQLSLGVTSFCPTTLTSPRNDLLRALNNVRDFIDEQQPSDESSRVLGAYFEGPYFNVKKKGAQPENAIVTPDPNEMDEYILASGGNIKVVALAPEIEGSIDLIERLSAARITAALAHTDGAYADAINAYRAGATLNTHLFNGMRGFTHREPGIAGAALTSDTFAELIVDGHHLHKAAVNLALRAKGTDQLVLVSDSIRATGLEDGTYDLGGQRIYAKNGKVTLEDGSLAGSTLTLNQAVYNVMHDNDVGLHDAVKMASLNPAKAIGVADAYGSITEGKVADLILFEDIRSINTVIKNGTIMERKT